MSLRARLFLLTVAMVIPAIATAWLALHAAYDRERQALERTLRETTRAMSLVVDRELRLREAVAASLSASPALGDETPAALRPQALAATQRFGGWVTVRDARSGELLLDTSDAPGPPAAAPPVADSAEISVSDVLQDAAGGPPYITVSVPARLGPQARPAIVSVALRPEHLHRVLEQQGLPPYWTAAILDRRGTIVARQPNPQRWTGQPATADVRERVTAGSEGLFRSVTLDGTAVTSYLSHSPAYGWAFIIGVPDAVAGAELRRAVWRVAAAAAALVLLAAVLAIVASRRIAVRVRRLQHTARLLEAGDAADFVPTGVHEFDEIGRTLVSASGRIRSAQDRLHDEVAAAVRETARAQERLAESQRLESLGRLTGGVAHDVNNLLSVVANNVFMLDRMHEGAGGAPQLAAIRRAVDTGRRLTQKLLAFSGRRAMRPERIDLARWLPEVGMQMRSSVASSVSVTLDIAPGTPDIDVDATELEVALLNLAVNANDAMPGGGTLAVTAAPAPPDDDGHAAPFVLITVRDTGEGIAPEMLDRVFEPFFTTKDSSKGSGLGLSQVYGFCTQSGGSVRIDSRPGEGTTVAMRLPGVPRPLASTPDGARAAAPIDRPPAARILYVEDNEDLARATASVLEAFGFQVAWAADADAAIRRLATERFDAVLSDIVMPGSLNGLAFARRMRELEPAVPIVLTTGYSRESNAAVDAGFEVLAKPCTPELLAAALNRNIAMARSR